jgi:hypothetical protein
VNLKTAVRGLTILSAIACLFVFAGGGLRAYFTADDVMNLYFAWSSSLGQLLKDNLIFFSGAIRPLGSLAYRVLLALFGFNPLPYRLVCFTLLLANLGLLYVFCLRLSRSREAAALACLLGAYHAHLNDLYYNSGTIYDLLCFFFYYLALTYYFTIREKGSFPGLRQSAILVILYILALDAKEMAVTLPVWVLLYEVIFHRPRPLHWANLRRWSMEEARQCWVMGPVTMIYVAGKLTGPNRIVNIPDYAPHIGLNPFMNGWAHYLSELSYNAIQIGWIQVVIIWLAVLAIALITRRQDLVFGWFAGMTGVLPVIFINPRGLYVLYIVLPAFYLFAAVSLVVLRDRVVGWGGCVWAGMPAGSAQLALFLAVALGVFAVHDRETRGETVPSPQSDPIRTLEDQLTARYPSMPHAANILFLSDPFDPGDWILTMFFRLHYRDKDLQVDRVKSMTNPPADFSQKHYQHVFTLTAEKLQESALRP